MVGGLDGVHLDKSTGKWTLRHSQKWIVEM